MKEKPELDLSHLHALILARSTIPETDVPFLLRRTGGLTNLHLGLAHEWEEQMFYEHSDCLAERLVLVSSTVEKLSVGLEYHPCYCSESHSDDEIEEWRNLLHRTLTRFTRLQVAGVPITFLLGFNPDYEANLDGSVLPDTLREHQSPCLARPRNPCIPSHPHLPESRASQSHFARSSRQQ